MSFIYDYTRLCWMYLLKDKSQDFETLKKNHGSKMKHTHILTLFVQIMVENIHLMNLKIIFTDMRYNIKRRFHEILNRMV